MTGLVERMRDTMLICKTDKRVHSAGAFLAIVLLVWFATSVWREPEPEKEKRVRAEKPPEDRINETIANFQKDLNENKQYRAQLGEVLKRAEGEVQANQQKIDWTFNNLIGKLDNMANRVDELADRIGSSRIDQTVVDRKIDARNKKKKKGAMKRVDKAEL